MRKIERLMNQAITDNTNWSLANTRVELDADGVSCVYLHGNLIAKIGEDFVQVFDGGWQSNTTKSRLNAITSAHCIDGEGVFQHKFNWYVRRYDNTAKDFVTEEFVDGYMFA